MLIYWLLPKISKPSMAGKETLPEVTRKSPTDIYADKAGEFSAAS